MWRELTGRDGMTNYEHSMYTGHISHFLRLYGNLYRFSQQGFEAMMSKVKCITIAVPHVAVRDQKLEKIFCKLSIFLFAVCCGTAATVKRTSKQSTVVKIQLMMMIAYSFD